MKHRCWVLVIAPVLACRSSGVNSDIQPDRVTGAPSASVGTLAPAPAPSASSEPPPPKERVLSVIVEGPCRELGVGFFENATLVHYGDIADGRQWGAPRPVFGFVGDDGTVVADPRLTDGLPTDAYGGLDIGEASGTWPTAAAIVLFNHGSERVETTSNYYVRRGDKWVDGRREPDPPGSPWVSGSSWLSGTRLLRLTDREPSFAVVPDGGAPVPSLPSVAPDANDACRFSFDDMVTRPNGDVFLAGQFCGVGPVHPGVYHTFGGAGVGRWSPGKKGVVDRLPGVKEGEELHVSALAEASPTTLYAIGNVSWENEEPYVAFHDGARWSRIPTPFVGLSDQQQVDADGILWLRTRKRELRRYDPAQKKWTLEPLKDVSSFALSGHRLEWAIAAGAVMHRDDAGAWALLAIPAPALTTSRATFSLTGVKVSPKGELWVSASYTERRPEWPDAEGRMALLRYGTPAHATRCDTAKGASFGSWPPPAKADCTTPLVILARISASAPADYDYPQTRRALRGRKEMEGAQLVEVDIDGKRVLGAKVKSIDVGQRLVEVQARLVWSARPESVCSDPKVIRPLPYDYKSGRLLAVDAAH